MMKAFLMCICLLVLVGCDRSKDSDSNDQTAKLAIQVVVGQYLTEDTARCPRVRLLVTDARTFADNKDNTPIQLVEMVRNRIKWDKLTPEQSGLISGMLLAIEKEMQQEITKKSDRDVVLKPMEDFLTWLDDTVKLVCPNGGTAAVSAIATTSSSEESSSSTAVIIVN